MSEEFKTRLGTTKHDLARVKGKMDSLLQAKEHAISLGDDAAAIKAKNEAQALQGQLEDLVITQAALEAKIRIISAEERDARRAKAAADYYAKNRTRIEYARQHGPICRCKRRMELREKELSHFGEAGGYGSGIWGFRCEACKIVTTMPLPQTELKPEQR